MFALMEYYVILLTHNVHTASVNIQQGDGDNNYKYMKYRNCFLVQKYFSKWYYALMVSTVHCYGSLVMTCAFLIQDQNKNVYTVV